MLVCDVYQQRYENKLLQSVFIFDIIHIPGGPKRIMILRGQYVANFSSTSLSFLPLPKRHWAFLVSFSRLLFAVKSPTAPKVAAAAKGRSLRASCSDRLNVWDDAALLVWAEAPEMILRLVVRRRAWESMVQGSMMERGSRIYSTCKTDPAALVPFLPQSRIDTRLRSLLSFDRS